MGKGLEPLASPPVEVVHGEIQYVWNQRSEVAFFEFKLRARRHPEFQFH